MLIAILQLVLTTIACGLLFVAWRTFRSDRVIFLLVAAGILIRAAVGQVLFWISYLELPFGRGMQEGGGFWFFATDGKKYFLRAAEAASERGLGALTHIDPTVVSPGYTQVLVLFALLFGVVASIGLLMNLAAYVGTCAIVVKLAGDQTRVARIAIAALSLSPASILWSTQPLKDVLFLFLFALFVAVAAAWIRAWQREQNALLFGVLATVALLLSFCVIAGIRWYFALVFFVVLVPLLVIVSMGTRKRLQAIVLLLLMCGAMLGCAVHVAGPFLPPSIRRMILSPRLASAARSPRMVGNILEGVRDAYDGLGGGTRMRPGTLISNRRAARFFSGSAALLLPHDLARATGLTNIGGGRGLWLFVDLDTIFFDVVLILAIIAVVRAPREKWRNAIFWLVLIVTLAMGAAFAYSVSNFGALFRYRSMIFIGVVMLPVAAVWRPRLVSP